LPNTPETYGQMKRRVLGTALAVRHVSPRASSSQRGYDARWRKYSRVRLKRDPLCVHCKAHGVLRTATVTDHIVPHRGDYELFWDPDNHQSLCITCHNQKTAKEDGGFGNRSHATDL